MKSFITTIILLIATLVSLHAQEVTDDSTITFGNDGQHHITYNADGIHLKLAGMILKFGSKDNSTQPQHIPQYPLQQPQFKSISPFGFAEVGVNLMVNAKYALYTPEEAAMMRLGNAKSIYMSVNLYSRSIRLNQSGSFTMDYGAQFTMENYRFNGPYSMKYEGGMMRPVKLEDSVTRSKLLLEYISLPTMFTWSYNHKFFVSCGLSIDILLWHSLMYLKPKVIDRVEPVTVEPIQFSGVLHFGTDKVYGFINYGLTDVFTYNTGPTCRRLSAGIGIHF